MIKFDVLERFSGKVKFTAEIDCDESEEKSVKLGLSVKWAIDNNADLRNADLRNADLWNADLRNADLRNANLRNANLRNANLSDADLRNADLWNADLWNANLWNADLRNANLRNANLRNADLRNADLSDADLRNADLRNADLWNAKGNKEHVKTIQVDTYEISYTSEVIHIGCQCHKIEDWWKFSDEEISKMDSGALEWWKVWKPVLQQIIEVSPAVKCEYKGK